MKHTVAILLAVLILAGCTQSKPTLPRDHSGTMVVSGKTKEAEQSKSFQTGSLTLYGKEGRLGIAKKNGDSSELFTVQQGALYAFYLWGQPEELKGDFKLVGTNRQSGEVTVLAGDEKDKENPLYQPPQLSSSVDANAEVWLKLGLDTIGLWQLDVYLGNKLFDSIFVKVHP